MAKKLYEPERKKMLSAYHRRENTNRHTENSIALIKRFGTKNQKATAKKKYVEFKKRGHQTHKDSQWFHKNSNRHYSKLIKSKK